MLLLTLRGTPTLYYGDEIGMQRRADSAGAGPGSVREERPRAWASAATRAHADAVGRAASNAGFTSGTPWLPLAADFATVNVEAQRSDPGSMLALYRALIELRRREPALAVGGYAPLAAEGPVLAYRRWHGGRQLLIALNLGSAPATLRLPAEPGRSQVLMSTLPGAGPPPEHDRLELRPDEGLIVSRG